MSSNAWVYLDSELEREREYWLQQLGGELVAASLPLDHKRPRAFAGRQGSAELVLPPSTQQQVLELCGGNELFVFTVLLAALDICLHKYSGLDDILVGTTIHEQHRETATFNKVLVIRAPVRGEMTARQLLLAVKQALAEAYANQKYPFERLTQLLHVEAPDNRAPLFNVAAMLENVNDPAHLAHLKHDLALLFALRDGQLTGRIEYNAELFQRQTIEVFGKHFAAVLQAIVTAPDVEIARQEFLSERERQALLIEVNETRVDYEPCRPVHQLFAEQARRHPDRVAVVCGEQVLSYGALEERANQLAAYLRAAGGGPGRLVGLYLEHSPEAVVAMLGVLKAGAAYVPLDPQHPRTRLAFMLQDAGINIVLTQERLADGELSDSVRALRLDADWPVIAQARPGPAADEATLDDLAYVIYTSGSTGEPKGVMIEHRALHNYIAWAAATYLRGEELAFPLYSSLAFDLTVTSIFVPLVTGSRIVVYRQDDAADIPLLGVLSDNQADILKLTPSHLSLLKGEDLRASRVRRLIVGGEAFDTELARSALAAFGPGLEVYNEYGPTEATVGCAVHKFAPEADNRALVPIGRPAANVEIYVLDAALKPVPVNVIGELYLSGRGLARGYLNQPQLTAERFIANPFIAGRWMYKTGDLARWLPEGGLEFIGRNDDQVKFHGYRVELNEIRSVLNKHPQVRESIVLLVQDENGYDVLLAYYVARHELPPAQLRDFLAEFLIDDTIPNIFVHLKKLPLTLNGKVNLAALPTLAEAKQQLKGSFVAPRTPVEQDLALIWSDLLGIEQVGIRDNFFELGGHSLMVTQVVSRLREHFNIDVPMRALFEAPTVADLAPVITKLQLEQHDKEEVARLLAEIQQLSDDSLEKMLAEATQPASGEGLYE